MRWDIPTINTKLIMYNTTQFPNTIQYKLLLPMLEIKLNRAIINIICIFGNISFPLSTARDFATACGAYIVIMLLITR